MPPSPARTGWRERKGGMGYGTSQVNQRYAFKMKTLFAICFAILLSSCTHGQRAQTFLRKVENMEHGSELPTDEAAELLSSDLPTLLSLTEADYKRWAEEHHGLKEGEYDIYPLFALSWVLGEQKRNRDYVLSHFDDIKHPDVKFVWAWILFTKGSRTDNVMRYLATCVSSENPPFGMREDLRREFLKAAESSVPGD